MRTFCVLLIPLQLVFLLIPRQEEPDLDIVTLNGQQCGPEGTATSAAGKDLDRHKNRYAVPDINDIDPEVSLAAMLAPGKDTNRFDQEKAAKVQGLVIDVKVGGKETCNCEAVDPAERDTHIELALSGDAEEIQRVIVEITPRLRMIMKKQNVDWSTNKVRQEFKGKWVEITGWLLFDSAHVKQAENTQPSGTHNWRATCWEVHPVTRIVALQGPPPETAGFTSTSLAAHQKLHAAHVERLPNGKSALNDSHKKLLSRFDKKELKEAEEEATERKLKK
jgi:hypothetical protein